MVRVSSRRGQVVVKARVTRQVPKGMVWMAFHFREGNANWLTNHGLRPHQPDRLVQGLRCQGGEGLEKSLGASDPGLRNKNPPSCLANPPAGGGLFGPWEAMHSPRLGRRLWPLPAPAYAAKVAPCRVVGQ